MDSWVIIALEVKWMIEGQKCMIDQKWLMK